MGAKIEEQGTYCSNLNDVETSLGKNGIDVPTALFMGKKITV